MNNVDESADKKTLSLAPKHNMPNANLVMMNCSDFSFLVSSDEIASLCPVQQVVMQPLSVHDCGYVEFEQRVYPVFCFNKALQLQTSLKEPHTAVVLFNHRNHYFGVTCVDVEKISDSSSQNAMANLTFYEVPICMRSRKQPFTEFAVINNRAAGLTSASALFTLLRLRGAKLAAQQELSNKVLQGAG